MFCMNCGKELPNGAKFCDKCGTKVGEITRLVKTDKIENINLSLQIKKAKCVTEYKNNTKVDNMDVVKFGKYQQSGLTGKKNEDIQWLVLEKQDDRALLLSKYIIDAITGMRMNAYKNWGHQEIREYLNTIFLEKAFTTTESSYILETKIIHRESDSDGETVSNDKLFFLSIDEINCYLKYEEIEDMYRKKHDGKVIFGGKDGCIIESLRAKASDCVLNKYKRSSDNKYFKWQTRSIGDRGRSVFFVDENGGVMYDNGTIANGIRPAMWVKI